MQALGEGPRQSRRMDAAQPLDLNFLHSILDSAFTPSALQILPLRGRSIPCPSGCRRLAKKEGALMGRLSAFCIKAKLGSPMQDFHLQGGTGLPISSICMITNTMQSFAAQPRGLNSLASNLNSKKTLRFTQRFFTSHISPRTRMTRMRRGSTYLK